MQSLEVSWAVRDIYIYIYIYIYDISRLRVNIGYVEKSVILTCETSGGFVYELVADKVLDDYATILCLCLQNKRGNVRVT